MKDISIITVNYKTPDLTVACIESVLQQRHVNFEMIVVDNDSQDNSVAILRKFSDRITLIENKENLGFGKANNQAFKYCNGKYLFLLNPDARLLSVDDLAIAIKFMDANPHYGLVGTRIVDSNHKLQHTISDHYPRQKQASVDFSNLPGRWACVLGASMIIRRDAYEKVQGFDEDYFLYAEETDLCLRLRKAGFQIGYLEDVTVAHVGGASAKLLPSEATIRRKKNAKYIFYTKHYPRQDVINIAKKDFSQARWHAFFLKIKSLFFGLNDKEKHKLQRHEISWEISKAFLQSMRKND